MLITAFLASLTLSLTLVPVVRRISFRLGLVAAPRADRWHKNPTPKIGGVGIFVAFGISLLATNIIWPVKGLNWPLLTGIGLIFILGLVDDLVQLSPTAKLVGEIIAAAIVVFFGRNIDFFAEEIINILFTFFWLVGITNAINLLDNMDGLAGGVAFIAASLLGFLSWQSGSLDLMTLSLLLAGSTLGFLVYNFPPASIFMGDSGSLFLGFSLASLAIARQPQASDLFAVMGVPTMLFLLPILDTTLVTITRILQGQSPAQGGRDHTSHRLIAFGLTERQTVLVLYAVTIIAGLFGIVIESIDYTISLVLIPIVMLTMTLLTAYLGRLKVIDPESVQPPQGGITSLMIGLTFRGRILEILFDLIIISIAYYLAFWIHFGTQVDIINLDIFLNSLPIALAGSYISFFIFGIYRGIFQYLGIRDLMRYGRAVLSAVLITAGIMSWIYYPLGVSLRIFVIFAVVLFLGVIISRSSFTILDQVYSQQSRDQQKEVPVLIYGAGESGVMLLRWLSQDTSSHLKPVGFIDDDPYKRGRQILGIQVLGNVNDLENTLQKTDAQGVLISSDQIITGEHTRKLKQICQSEGIWLKRLRIEFEALG